MNPRKMVLNSRRWHKEQHNLLRCVSKTPASPRQHVLCGTYIRQREFWALLNYLRCQAQDLQMKSCAEWDVCNSDRKQQHNHSTWTKLSFAWRWTKTKGTGRLTTPCVCLKCSRNETHRLQQLTCTVEAMATRANRLLHEDKASRYDPRALAEGRHQESCAHPVLVNVKKIYSLRNISQSRSLRIGLNLRFRFGFMARLHRTQVVQRKHQF